MGVFDVMRRRVDENNEKTDSVRQSPGLIRYCQKKQLIEVRAKGARAKSGQKKRRNPESVNTKSIPSVC